MTEPLTRDEAWTAFAPGELRVFVDDHVSVEVDYRLIGSRTCVFPSVGMMRGQSGGWRV